MNMYVYIYMYSFQFFLRLGFSSSFILEGLQFLFKGFGKRRADFRLKDCQVFRRSLYACKPSPKHDTVYS